MSLLLATTLTYDAWRWCKSHFCRTEHIQENGRWVCKACKEEKERREEEQTK